MPTLLLLNILVQYPRLRPPDELAGELGRRLAEEGGKGTLCYHGGLGKGLKKTEESVTTFHLGLPPPTPQL